MDLSQKIKMLVAGLIIVIAGLLASDSCSHAQTSDTYAIQEKVAVNSTLIDQILKHDAEVDVELKVLTAANFDMGSRISHMEGAFAGVIGLLGIYLASPFFAEKWKKMKRDLQDLK